MFYGKVDREGIGAWKATRPAGLGGIPEEVDLSVAGEFA
jgi:hypothetical protein